jgi:citrate lyase subunit gamma (acyl carrier protein)
LFADSGFIFLHDTRHAPLKLLSYTNKGSDKETRAMQHPKVAAQAGTLESSDILVMVEPVEPGTGRQIDLESNVMTQYGERIKEQVTRILDALYIADVHILVKDKGALDATIWARVETALQRSL